jgi:glycosyltransferase involved in cell wall biosynthesis
MKLSVIMPVYNEAGTIQTILKRVLATGLPDEIILVDDASKDDTVRIAKGLGLTVMVHRENMGYGANQKTCYIEALKEDADIIVMVHPDYQYDPKLLPELIKPIVEKRSQVVLGSRILAGNVLKRGMPIWKYISNRFLTFLENMVLGKSFTEYHTGYRAYSKEILKSVPFTLNSDNFIFDQEILFQICHYGFNIIEVPVPAKYFPEASTTGFLASLNYGFGILYLILKYLFHQAGILRNKQFEFLSARYIEIAQSER